MKKKDKKVALGGGVNGMFNIRRSITSVKWDHLPKEKMKYPKMSSQLKKGKKW